MRRGDWETGKRLAAAAVLLLVQWTSTASMATTLLPQDVVGSFHDYLLAVWKEARQVSAEQRFRRLEPAVGQAFDLERMIRTATGTAWAEASESDRQRLVKAFSRYSAATYASQFKSHAGETFETLAERPGPRGLMLVETRIVSPTAPSVALTYVLANERGHWQIVDVLLENKISQMAIRRSEYRSILHAGGPPLLVEKLDDQTDRLLAEK
jgi:phospholipid transport system substrate-binding protein